MIKIKILTADIFSAIVENRFASSQTDALGNYSENYFQIPSFRF